MRKWLRRKKFAKPTEESMRDFSKEMDAVMERALDAFDPEQLGELVSETRRLIDLGGSHFGASPEDINAAGNAYLWTAIDLYKKGNLSAIPTHLAGAYLKARAQSERLEAPKTIVKDIDGFLTDAPEKSRFHGIEDIKSMASALGMEDLTEPFVGNLERVMETEKTQDE